MFKRANGAATLLITSFFLFQQVTCEQHQSGKVQHIPKIGLCIVFIFGSLLYGGFLKMIARRTYIPYNPLLLFSGLLFGKYNQQFPSFISHAILLVSELNPHSILAIFLPPIIFASAYKVEWNLFRKQIAQTLMLGVPSVFVSSFLIMASLKLIIDDNHFSWTSALLLGSVLSCTQIFSFASKLKEQGTPKKVIGMIEGESLFNYCSCVMLFQIMNELIMNEQYSYIGLLALFIQEIFGGILFGAVFAALAIYWLKRMAYDGVLIVSVMIIFCYTIFIVTEFTSIPVSGICALVSYGILMAGFGRNQISNQSNQYVSGFWKYAVFSAQTSIFFIAGVMVGVNVVAIRSETDAAFFSTLFTLYVLVFLSRFFSIAIFMKWLPKLGYGMQWKQAIVVAVGGLKGAIGISFAMIVFQDTDHSQQFRGIFLLYVTGNSLLTLFLNSIIARLLIKYLGISTLTKVQYKFFKEFLIDFKKQIYDKIEELRDDRFLDLVDWTEVQKKVGIMQYNKLEQKINSTIEKIKQKNGTRFEKRQLYKLQLLLRQFATKNTTVAPNMAETQFIKQITQFDTLVEIRKRYIKSLIGKYWQYHQTNHTSPAAIKTLLQSAYFDLDTQTQELDSWQWIKTQISQPYIRFLSELRKNKLIGSIARTYLFEYIFYCYDVVSSYIQAHEQVSKQFKEMNLIAMDESSVQLVLGEGSQNKLDAQIFLTNYLKPSFPQIEAQLKTKKASFNVLFMFKNIIDRFQQTGQLEANQYELLNSLVIKKTLTLELHSPKWNVTPFAQLYKQHDVFGLLPKRVLQMLDESLADYQTYDSNQFIITQSSMSKYFYFIRRGSCTIEFTNLQHAIYKNQLTVGDVFGIETLVSPLNQSNVIANAMVIALRVKKICIQKIMDTFPDFEEEFWKKYLFYFYKMFFNRKDISFFLNSLQKCDFDHGIKQFKLVKLEKGFYLISQDTIFLRGSCIQSKISQKVSPMSFFTSGQESSIQVQQKSSFLMGKFPFNLQEKLPTRLTSLVLKASGFDHSPLGKISKVHSFQQAL